MSPMAWNARGNARSPLWFALAGAIGFAVDASILKVLVSWFGWDPVLARAISFPCAVTATYWFNRRFTFGGVRSRYRGQAYALYVVGQTLGALLNVGAFVWLVAYAPWFARHPVTTLAAAAAVALSFNYWWSSRLVFSSDSGSGASRRRAA